MAVITDNRNHMGKRILRLLRSLPRVLMRRVYRIESQCAPMLIPVFEQPSFFIMFWPAHLECHLAKTQVRWLVIRESAVDFRVKQGLQGTDLSFQD